MRIIFAAAAMAVCWPAFAADIEVKSAWARATVRAQKTSSAYLELKSRHAAVLVAASSPVAGSVELHEMKMEGDVMKMREIRRLPLPAGQAVTLTPGGYHLMLFGLKAQLKDGERVPLRLEFEQGGRRETVEASAEVRGVR